MFSLLSPFVVPFIIGSSLGMIINSADQQEKNSVQTIGKINDYKWLKKS